MGRESGGKDHPFLLDRKALTQFNRVLRPTNVKALVGLEFPVLILTKQETRREAKTDGLPTETVSVFPGLWLVWPLLSARATAGQGLSPHMPQHMPGLWLTS